MELDNTPNFLLDLLEQQGARLHGLLFKMTLQTEAAEELLQELFLRLVQSNGLRQASHPQAYLYPFRYAGAENTEDVGGAPCVVLEGKVTGWLPYLTVGENEELIDRLWLDVMEAIVI